MKKYHEKIKKITLYVIISISGLSLAIGIIALKGRLFKPPAVYGVPSMEGYVSRYNPGHISSGEAFGMAKGSAAILDLQSEGSYINRHVSGAINVAYDNLEEYAGKNLTDKNQLILCYCFCGDMGGTALSAYKLLAGLGYKNVYYMEPEEDWVYEGAEISVFKILSGTEAKKIYDENPGAILLDVRNENEYNEWHIKGSMLIPVSELESRIGELTDKNAVIIVYCKAGVRSGKACEILKEQGFENVYDMQSIDNWPAQ